MSVLTLPVCFSCFTIAEREREECGKRERWGWGEVGESERGEAGVVSVCIYIVGGCV